MRRSPYLLFLALLTAACGFPEVATAPTSSLPSSDSETVATTDDPAADATLATPPLADESEGAAWADMALTLEPIAEIANPISITGRSGTLNLYVANRDGVIHVLERTISPEKAIERIRLSSRPMLDLTGLVSLESEQGLLNVTFSSDGRDMFVYYTDLNGDVVVDKYEVDRSDRASYDDRIELIRVPQPAPNHNGGGLAVGPDGFLYIGLGDGGGAGDPEQTGQDPRDLLGSLLRIDPVSSETSTYAVPVSNPFADGVDGAPEVWTYGARNPWRLSFDQLTGDLWIGDVGQNAIEEIDKLAQSDGGGRGANLGWNLVEGNQPYEGGQTPANHTAPIYVYGHDGGRCSVTGGHVSRAELMPQFDGVYIFGDYCTGEIFGLAMVDGAVLVRPLQVTAAGGELVSFGQDTLGRVFVVESGGRISRIAPAPADAEG
ncbi:MAG: PQQ-dependent sugar dehydrogenase [Acidimicrobiales bacterium]